MIQQSCGFLFIAQVHCTGGQLTYPVFLNFLTSTNLYHCKYQRTSPYETDVDHEATIKKNPCLPSTDLDL